VEEGNDYKRQDRVRERYFFSGGKVGSRGKKLLTILYCGKSKVSFLIDRVTELTRRVP